MTIPAAAEAQLAAAMQQAGQPAPQTVPPQVMQQAIDPGNPQMPEMATMPTMDQVTGEVPLQQAPMQQPQQMAQPQQQQYQQPQQQGIAQQPPQQMTPDATAQQLNMMHGRLRAANDQIKQLQGQNQMQQAQQPAPFQQSQPQSVSQASDITRDECLKYYSKEYIDEWGEDAVKQQLAAQKNVAASMAPQQPQQNTEDVHKLAQQFFHSELARYAPNYMQVENTPAFEAWLNSNMEQLSGFTYKQLLDDAYGESDAHRAASIFDMYLRQGAGNPVNPPQQQVPQPQYQQPMPQVPAQTIMPSASGAPMPNGNGMPAQTMNVHQWNAAMADLPSQGLSPLEMANKQQELTTMFKRGQVAGTTGANPIPNTW